MTKAQIKWVNKQLEASTDTFTSRSWDDIASVFNEFNRRKRCKRLYSANEALKVFYKNAKIHFNACMKIYKDSQSDLAVPHYLRGNAHDCQVYMQEMQNIAMQHLAKARLFYRFYKEHKAKL